MNIVIVEFNYVDRSVKFRTDGNIERNGFAFMPTNGRVNIRCKLHYMTGLSWMVKLKETVDLKGGEELEGEAFEY